jgi:hypothetical protein
MLDNAAIPLKRFDGIPGVGTNIGAIASASAGYVNPIEMGAGPYHQTLLEFNGLPVVTGNTTGISFGSKQLYTFPQGRIHVLGVTAYFREITFNTLAGATGDIGGTGSGDYAIGSTATADGTLATTDVDLLPSSAMLDPFVAGIGRSNAGTALAAAASFDGTSAALSAYLNVIIDDADVADAAASDNVYFTGWVRMTWLWLGDY